MLHISGLSAAPRGKTYEAWVIPKGRAPRPAGLFPGGASETVRLRGTVPRNAVVAVTRERAGGASTPTPPVLFSTPT
jgi:anti-sigma-K factor RskA